MVPPPRVRHDVQSIAFRPIGRVDQHADRGRRAAPEEVAAQSGDGISEGGRRGDQADDERGEHDAEDAPRTRRGPRLGDLRHMLAGYQRRVLTRVGHHPRRSTQTTPALRFANVDYLMFGICPIPLAGGTRQRSKRALNVPRATLIHPEFKGGEMRGRGRGDGRRRPESMGGHQSFFPNTPSAALTETHTETLAKYLSSH